jgi:Ca2+-binding EF-hand superfamily protein
MRLSLARQPLAAIRLSRPRGIATLATKARSTFRSGVAVISTLFLVACAPADNGFNTALPPPSTAFDLVDTDADGAVEVEEWNEAGSKVFASLDTDHSGSISPTELEAGFESLDINRDGIIDAGEADIPSLDSNGDSVISRAEWRGDIIQRNLDIDSDGSVSRAEFEAHQMQAFAIGDRNRNGRIDRIDLAPNARRFTLFTF